MAIQYAGGTIVNTTFTGTAKTDIVTNLETQLVAAGWSVLSGAGTQDVVLQSATTPEGNWICCRLRSGLVTNCATINMQNTSGLKITGNMYLLPGASKTFRIIANKYQFFIFTPGASAAREFAAMGVPWIPSFLSGVITDELGWASGNGGTDTSTSVVTSFRTALYSGAPASVWCAGLINGSLMDFVNNSPSIGSVRFIVPITGRVSENATTGYRWYDDSLNISDPLLAWGNTSIADEGKIKGQIWDAMLASDAFAGDTTLASFDGHAWHAITNNAAGSTTDAKGCLFLATS